MRAFITGDVHGEWDLHKLTSAVFKAGKTLTKEDIVFVAGDLGAVWGGNQTDKYYQDWYESKQWTTCSVDGNHENHDLLEKLPEVPFHGGIAKKVNDSLYYLNRGEVYNFNGKTIFAFGGGKSIDKVDRTEGVSWWEQEIPTEREYENAMRNLDRHNFEVDYVITHTAPMIAINRMITRDSEAIFYYNMKADDQTVKYLSNIENVLKYKAWYFGHFHREFDLGEGLNAVYNNIIELKI